MDNTLHRFGDKLTHSNVIQEKKWLSPTGEDIIDTVIYQVDTYGIVFFQGRGDLKLRPHSICAGDDNRLMISLEFKLRAEKADIA